MLSGPSSRRDFIRSSGALVAGAGVSLSLWGCQEAAESAAEAMRAGEPPRVLTGDEARTLEVFSDHVLPPDGDGPGAAAMGAVVFMDHYAARRPDMLEALRGGVAALGARVREAHPDVAGFHELGAEAADAILRDMAENAPESFWPLHMLVVFGAFAAPAQGGNRDKAGWALLGYDDRMAWQPPFGFYDAQAATGAAE